MSVKPSHSLLGNAVNSIRVGVEDSHAVDRGRWVSAVRNIHAGILLLYKEKLRRMSPPDSEDVLLKTKNIPFVQGDGTVSFKGTGLHTVDMQQIQIRFEALQIEVDWKALQSVTALRNQMEHYFENASNQLVFEVIAKCYLLIRDFMRDHLQENPLDLLGADAWMRMLDKAEVVKKERLASEAAIKSHPWVSQKVAERAMDALCEECGSTLLEPEHSDPHSGLKCRKCGHSMLYFAFLMDPRCIFRRQDFPGGAEELRILDCPNCNDFTFAVALGLCGNCGHEANPVCSICGAKIFRSWDLRLETCAYCREIFHGIPLA